MGGAPSVTNCESVTATAAVLVGHAARVASAVGADVVTTTETFDFFWRGQFAGFIVKGQFSYNQADVPPNGIVREEHLLSLDVSFYDPQGVHLRTYSDNHLRSVDSSGNPYVNFAFDTLSQELLQDGTFNVDDDIHRYRNGFTPHLHVDDWNNATGAGEFGFPIGYSSHKDASFAYATTADKIEGGKAKRSA
ncbi:hypothetical protein EMIHUDRAFT_245097 [Emiliania huxleyi CCMP1516]|uniref:Uncharacterized protein n=2 Tax=Emiliania huxleyi TaxID=2903 RepID=A0A0D3IYY2_EMIH1|nr:hypothetical protein EMIHUDRAFT_245097 [Emiliania huxleyi CCMP1516]EOD16467.1 hypothetical protein EMIHUDRAFT_245097 [Emiliania huxleyi CCMP1516]|eukprot:XP_005768896.1 hypothetical protein EMIHUDRAFT_245097 [Emiliania huxleyi CCMP1516]